LTSVLDGNNGSVSSTDRFTPGETVSDILLIECCVGLRGDLDMLGMREMLSLTVTRTPVYSQGTNTDDGEPKTDASVGMCYCIPLKILAVFCTSKNSRSA
jgi:hypothetical protein